MRHSSRTEKIVWPKTKFSIIILKISKLFRLIGSDILKKKIDNLLRPVSKKSGHIATGIFSSFFLLSRQP